MIELASFTMDHVIMKVTPWHLANIKQYSTTKLSQFRDSGNSKIILGPIQPSNTQIDFISGMRAKPL